MEKFIFILVTLQLLTLFDVSGQSLTALVQTNKGPVQGLILTTVQNSIEYAAFKGIPYAKPPLGRLRFKPPTEADSWSTPLSAVSDPPPCPQGEFMYNMSSNQENCLYVNVYTPKTNFGSKFDELLPVMVFIHGGGYFSGSMSSSLYGPDFLIEDNVVVVGMNYRLGVLGFLNLNHPSATGNAGLKDQVMALKWVQANIDKFGGDPKKVTIFGQSAGGASVELHKISDKSRGLFSRSIAMSGSGLNFWAFASNKVIESNGFALGRNLGLSTTDKEVLLENLYNTKVHELIAASFSLLKTMNTPFKPIWEDESVAGQDAFLTECVLHKYRAGEFHKLPHMLGFTSEETISTTAGMIPMIVNIPLGEDSRTLNSHFDGTTIDKLNSVRNNKEIMGRIKEAVDISSNLGFAVDIDRTQQYLSQGSAPVYYYRNSFDYSDSLHRVEGLPIDGTGHFDDIFQIFWLPDKLQSLDPNSEIGIQRKKMVRLWTNFARFGNPTPSDATDGVLDFTWTPSKPGGDHLEIGNSGFMMKSRPVDIFLEILQNLFESFGEILNGCPPKMFGSERKQEIHQKSRAFDEEL